MGVIDHRHTSFWQRIEFPPNAILASDHGTDVCIVGGGISGLSVAYHLLREGHRVTVLEKLAIGLGETGLSSAHISNALDDRFVKLIKQHGVKNARLAYESHTAAMARIEEIIARENIDCDFRRVNGYLFLDSRHKESDLDEELKASHEVGFHDVVKINRAPIQAFDTGACLMFPRQAQFQPVKYVRGLAEAVRRMGGVIFTNTEVNEVQGGQRPYVVTSNGYKVHCKAVVTATNVPFQSRVVMHTKEAAYRSYVIGLEVPKGWMRTPSLLWDMGDPYHYIRMDTETYSDRDILLVGGEDHKTGQAAHAEERYQRLQGWAESHLGVHARIVSSWSGQVIEPIDSLAFIGAQPAFGENVYTISGDSGNGLTHSTIAGMLIADQIAERENPWTEIYDPTRKNWKGLKSYVQENLNTAMQYTDWISTGDVASVSQISDGEGAVVRSGFSKIAAYRDDDGQLHQFSVTCPHLGGVVRWNSAEETWDCPCHGSRFDKKGKLLNGPAKEGLAPVGEPLVDHPHHGPMHAEFGAEVDDFVVDEELEQELPVDERPEDRVRRPEGGIY